MANSSSQENVSAHHSSDAEEDIFTLLDNLSPGYEGFPELDLTPQQQNESASVNQELLQENVKHPPVDAKNQISGSCRVVYWAIPSKDKISREVLTNYFHLPVREAAQVLEIKTCNFRKRCRELGIEHWPYQEFRSLDLTISNFEELRKNPRNFSTEALEEAILLLKDKRQALLEDPNLPLEHITKRLKKSFHVREKKNKKVETSSNNEQGD